MSVESALVFFLFGVVVAAAVSTYAWTRVVRMERNAADHWRNVADAMKETANRTVPLGEHEAEQLRRMALDQLAGRQASWLERLRKQASIVRAASTEGAHPELARLFDMIGATASIEAPPYLAQVEIAALNTAADEIDMEHSEGAAMDPDLDELIGAHYEWSAKKLRAMAEKWEKKAVSK